MIRLRALIERSRESLYAVPVMIVAALVVLSQVMIWVDRSLVDADRIPDLLIATVSSARVLLSTVAGATITVAGIAFSVSLLQIQLASAQLSPRVLRAFFRDPVNKRTIGLSAGTFTFCLLVLRVVRQPAEEGGSPVIPNISVLVATGLGVGSILAIIKFISHSAHSMQAGEIIRRITEETHEQISRLTHEPGDAEAATPPQMPEGPSFVALAPQDGWVQRIDFGSLTRFGPPGTVVRLDTYIGAFVVHDTPLCTVWPPPQDSADAGKSLRSAFVLGRSRTMQQDLSFGLRQLTDIALRALSPGVNDPTTADEVIVHLGSLMRHLLIRDLPPRVRAGDDGRVLVMSQYLDHDDYMGLAFDQLRRAVDRTPAVLGTMLEVLGMLLSEVERHDLPDRGDHVRRIARLAIDHAIAADLHAADRDALIAQARAERLIGEIRLPGE